MVGYNGMMRGPAHYRRQDDSLIGEGTIGIVANGVTQQMGITGRIRKIVFALVLMYP